MNNDHSSDSEDGVPLSAMRDVVSYDRLQRKTKEQCEFCDRIFSSRMASIQHNATHIIIPLVKLTLHQCDECLYQFSSPEELRTHVASKHRTQQARPKQIDYDIIQSIINKQVYVKCHDILNDVIRLSPKIHIIHDVKAKNIPVKIKSIPLNSVHRSIPTFVISSESESDSECRKREDSRPKTKQSHPREHSHPEIKYSHPEIKHSHTKRENSSERDHSPVQRKHSKSKSKHSSPEDEQVYSDSLFKNSSLQMENSHPKMEHSDPEDEQEYSESDQDIPETENVYVKNETEGTFKFSPLDNLSSPGFIRKNSSPDYEPSRSKIIYEDDLLNTDLTEEYQYKTKIVRDSFILDRSAMSTLNRVIIGTVENGKDHRNGSPDEHFGSEDYVNAVHYDELVIQGICDCRYCGRCFPNRFELIKHEAVHIHLRKPRPRFCAVCERYMAGNYQALRRHMQAKHPMYTGKRFQVKKCEICHLNYFNYKCHASFYHQLITNKELETHLKVVKMCEMCLKFIKNKNNLQYEVIGELSEIGVRQQCDKCHSKHFDVTLVKRKILRDAAILRQCIKRRPMSNKDRLKKMQKRLKMVNKMNKCWGFCFIGVCNELN